MNKIMLIGRVGRDPDLNYLASGVAVVILSIATTEKFTNKQGEKVEQTEWHRVVAYDNKAEVLAQYLTKGSLIYVAGKQTSKKWTDKNGNERTTPEIILTEFEFLSPKSSQNQEVEQPKERQTKKQQNENIEHDGDDIPF